MVVARSAVSARTSLILVLSSIIAVWSCECFRCGCGVATTNKRELYGSLRGEIEKGGDLIQPFSERLSMGYIDWATWGHYFHEVSMVGGSCLLYTSPSPRDRQKSRMPSSA